MADLVNLTIDGIRIAVAKGTLIVDAAKRAGVDIPVFCYHPQLRPVGMCRMCLVEVGRAQKDRTTGQWARDEQGQIKTAFGPKLETACTTPVDEEMVVVTTSEKVKVARQDIIEFLLTSHPLDCPICDKGGECPLQNLTLRHGPAQSRFIYEDKQHLAKHVPLSDRIYLDRERCIQCGRCVRFQKDVADDPVIGFYRRGRKMQIATFSDPGFDSQWSGNTTDLCPVGALTTADFRFGARPWEMTLAPSICPLCPVGCNITLSLRREAKAGGQFVIKRVQPRQNEAVNEIWICDRGRFDYHFIEGRDRLATPLIRKQGALKEATWDEALDLIADKFKAAGANLVGLAGDQLSNEDLFAFRKVVTRLGGKAELDSARGGGEFTSQAGVSIGTNLKNLGKDAAILVMATDLEKEAPIWWLRVKQAAERGARLIVVNARASKLERYTSFQVHYTPGTELATFQELTVGTSAAAQALAQSEKVVIFLGGQGLDFASSTALAKACANWLTSTKRAGKPNNGLIMVWPHNNTQGAWELGVRPDGQPLAVRLQGVQALWLAATDPIGHGRLASEALPEFVVVQDLYLTETAKHASVVLPAAAWAEREGSYTSGERRVQRFYPALAARGKPDYEIAQIIGARAGVPLPSQAAEIMVEIATSCPAFMDVSYAGLAKTEEQWPQVGGRDMYYGGTAYKNDAGLGQQLRLENERSKATTRKP